MVSTQCHPPFCTSKQTHHVHHHPIPSIPSTTKQPIQIIYFPASTGNSHPTLLAVSRIFSSSFIDMPGLYKSSKCAYIRCALAYCAICSASWIRCVLASVFASFVGAAAAVVVVVVVVVVGTPLRKSSRRRLCSGVVLVARRLRRGCSRRRAR